MTARVAIVGGGLSSAFAALACRELGIEADILVNAFPSISPVGLLLIHAVPKTLRTDVGAPWPLAMYKVGNEEDYIAKQWGDEFVGTHPRSGRFSQLPMHWNIWDPKDVWNALWKRSLPRFITVENLLTDIDLTVLADDYDAVFHTFPTAASRQSQPRQATYGIVEWPLGPGHHLKAFLHATAIYNGIRDVPWTRMFVGFNKVSVELTIGATANLEPGTFVPVRISHPDTKPWTERLHHRLLPLGRWATWDHHKLSHDAYMDVIQYFNPGAQASDYMIGDEYDRLG